MNVIAHNIQAMNTNRQLNINTRNKAARSEKLSSGYRINRAADDTAGLAISEKMRWQIRGLSRGAKNSQDGISLCQVADGALAEVSDMLHRITELSVQAANDTNTEADRKSIQKEINQILCEIDRIGDTTEFNEHPVFRSEKKNVVAPPDPGAGVTPGADNVDIIRNSIKISGTQTNLTNGKYTVNASAQGITINGTSVSWSEIKDSKGTPIDVNAISEENYHYELDGVTFEFETKSGAVLDDLINAIDGTEFKVDRKSIVQDAVSISDISIVPGTKTDELLSGNPLLGGKTAYIAADNDGIMIKPNSYSVAYTKMTWAQMGIDDINNAGGKTFAFADPVTGVNFTGKISDGTTKDEVIQSMNGINFKWDYIDRNTSSNSTLILNGINVPRNGGIITNKQSEVRLSDMAYKQYGGSGDYYSKIGYTTPSEIINGAEISLSMIKNADGKLALKITSAKGNEHLMPLNDSKTSELSQKGYTIAAFGDFDNVSENYNLVIPGIKDFNAKKNLMEKYVGQEIATVKLPSPYKYSINPKQVTRTEFYISGYTTNENKNVNPNPAPGTPDTPGQDNKTEKKRLWIQSGCEEGSGMFLEIDNMNTSVLGIDDVDVSTSAGAGSALKKIHSALAKVSSNRSTIGAQQNRLEHTMANGLNEAENTSFAESRIRDADMAKEMVSFSKEMILEQVSQAMSAQANNSSMDVLNLLR